MAGSSSASSLVHVIRRLFFSRVRKEPTGHWSNFEGVPVQGAGTSKECRSEVRGPRGSHRREDSSLHEMIGAGMPWRFAWDPVEPSDLLF